MRQTSARLRSNAVFRVLHIEDDETCLAGLRECAETELGNLVPHVELNLFPARTIHEAIVALEREPPPFDVLVVDLMLPRDEAALKRQRVLHTQRRPLVRQLFAMGREGTTKSDEASALRHRIGACDEELRRLAVDAGGIEIVAKLVDRNEGRPLERPVIFFTARGLPAIRDRCLHLVNPEYLRFLEKPVREIDVLRAVVELVTNSTR